MVRGPKIERAVRLMHKDYPTIDIERRAETLPCFKQHEPKEDILIVAEKLALCPCGKIYFSDRKKPVNWVQLTPILRKCYLPL